jgi:hypothetical protein
MAKTLKYEGLVKEARTQRVKLEASSKRWATNAELWGSRKLQTERKWIGMNNIQPEPEYRAGVFSAKHTIGEIEAFTAEATDKDLANAAVMACVLSGTERTRLNFERALRAGTAGLRYVVLDEELHAKAGKGGFLRRMAERQGSKLDRSLSRYVFRARV